MKIFFKLLLATIGITCISSCYKDLGNYTYTDLNEVRIGGIDTNYVIFEDDRLTIRPELSFTNAADTSLFTFEWRWIGVTGIQTDSDSLLFTGVNLDMVFDWTPGSYEMYYRVTEKATGLIYTHFFTLGISALGYEGWLLLSDVNGQSRLDMLSLLGTTYVTQLDILAAMGSNVVIEGAPLSLHLSYNPFGQQVYVVTPEDGYHIETSQNTYQEGILGILNIPFSTLIPSSAGLGFTDSKAYMGVYTDYIYANGDVYARNYNAPEYPVAYTIGPFNNDNQNNRFNVAPFIATARLWSNPQAMIFNTDNKTMYRYEGIGTAVISNPIAIAGLNMQNYALVFMDYSAYNGGYIFTVFNDTTSGRYYLAQFNMSGDLAFFGELDGPEIADAEHFTIHPIWGYLLYSVGGNIYEFDLGTSQTSLVHSYSEEKISFLQFPKMLAATRPDYFINPDPLIEYAEELIVCTYDEANPTTSGKFQRYDVPTLNQPFILLEAYEGFGKIVGVVYNEK